MGEGHLRWNDHEKEWGLRVKSLRRLLKVTVLRTSSMEDPTIVLTSRSSTSVSTIKHLDPNTASRTLGVFLSPTSEWTKQIEVLKAKMDKLAGRLLTSSLSFDDVRVFYQSIYSPSIRYVLPALSIDEKHLEEIQTRSIEALLIRKGFNRHLPRRITHGPQAWGSLSIPDIKTEGGWSLPDQGISSCPLWGLRTRQTDDILSQVFPDGEWPGLSSFGGSQSFISWLTPTWIMSLHAFILKNHNITITLTDCWYFLPCCKHAQYLVEPALTGLSFNSSEYEHINCVRMHFQVATLSNISDGNGQTVNKDIMAGQ